AQGLKVVVVRTTDVLTAQEVRAGQAGKLLVHIHALCRAHQGPSFVLLAGTIPGPGASDPVAHAVPALPGTTGRMKGEPSDHRLGCPSGGVVPEVPVGRFPARSVAEVETMVARTLAYEEDRPADWRRRVTVLAGIPAYNPLA